MSGPFGDAIRDATQTDTQSPWADTTYFAPSKEFILNLAIDDLDGVLASCATHGVEAIVPPDEPNGRFERIVDPEGAKIELWQPKPMPA